MPIIVSTGGREARRLQATDLPDERFLQSYVVDNPDALPLDELRDGLRLVVLAKEVPTASGPIDAVGIDQRGDVYLIETKLFRNPDKRKVVAQVLDYGAAVWAAQGDRSFRRDLERAAAATSSEPVLERIARCLDLASSDEADELLRRAEEAIQDGRFHFVVLMDRLDDRLKDLISFLNENSNFDVLAVEMEFYRFDEHEVVIPKLHGSVARKIVPRRGGIWDAASFFREAGSRLDQREVEALRDLFGFFTQHADEVRFGKGAATGSFLPTYLSVSPKAALTVYTSGRIEFNFGWCRGEDGRPASQVLRLADELRRRAGLDLPDESLDRFPGLKPDAWVPKLVEIKEAFRVALAREGGGSAGEGHLGAT